MLTRLLTLDRPSVELAKAEAASVRVLTSTGSPVGWTMMSFIRRDHAMGRLGGPVLSDGLPDHLVSADRDGVRDVQLQGRGCLEIDHQLELRRKLDG
jgi:hypothetical protein